MHRRREIAGGVDPTKRRLPALVGAHEAVAIEHEAQPANEVRLALTRTHDGPRESGAQLRRDIDGAIGERDDVAGPSVRKMA